FPWKAEAHELLRDVTVATGDLEILGVHLQALVGHDDDAVGARFVDRQRGVGRVERHRLLVDRTLEDREWDAAMRAADRAMDMAGEDMAHIAVAQDDLV